MTNLVPYWSPCQPDMEPKYDGGWYRRQDVDTELERLQAKLADVEDQRRDLQHELMRLKMDAQAPVLPDEPESRTQIDRVEYPCGCVASFNGMILMTCAEHSPKGNK